MTPVLTAHCLRAYRSRRSFFAFWAYFHEPNGLRSELEHAGVPDVALVAVEGFGWLLSDLPARMERPDDLLRAIRLTETDPSIVGVSAHVLGIADRG